MAKVVVFNSVTLDGVMLVPGRADRQLPAKRKRELG